MPLAVAAAAAALVAAAAEPVHSLRMVHAVAKAFLNSITRRFHEVFPNFPFCKKENRSIKINLNFKNFESDWLAIQNPIHFYSLRD